MDISDDNVDAEVENISSPSSVTELSAGEEATMETIEEGEELSKHDEEGEVSNNDDDPGEMPSKAEGEQPSKDEEEGEEGEEGEILSDSDEDDQAAAATEATNEATSNNKSSEESSSKKGSSQDRGSRDGRRSPSPRDRYQDRRRYRYSGHSQSPSSSSRNAISGSNHLARKGVKRPASNDRRTGTDIRNRKEGSPFTKRKPKMKAPPPSNSPFWGERKHLLPTPSVSPRTGYNLDSDYPQLPRRLVKEYFPEPPIRFVRDSHNFSSTDHSKSDYSQSTANRHTERDNDASSQSPPSVVSNEEDTEDMAAQECEGAVPSLPSMQDLVKSQLYNNSNNESEALPPPLIEDKSMDTAETLADVFSEDFPLLDGETPDQEEATSLKKLVAGGSGVIDITIAAGEQKVALTLSTCC